MQTDRPDSRWYAIRTQRRFEKIVREQLVNQGIETLLPLRTRTSQWKNRTKVIAVPLFPEYCFARLSGTQRPLVQQTPGVLEILAGRNESVTVIAEAMAALQTLIKTSISYESHPYPEEGAMVEVTRGPLTGTHGRFLRRGARPRFVIPISVIGKAVAVDIEPADVKAVAGGNLSIS